MVSVRTASQDLRTEARIYSISTANDLSLISSLGLFISLCFLSRDTQVVMYGLWLISQLTVGWGLFILLLKLQKQRTILFEIWSVSCFSYQKPHSHGCRVLNVLCFSVTNLLFAWRYYSVPQNWTAIGNSPTWVVVIMALLANILFASTAVINAVCRALEIFLAG